MSRRPGTKLVLRRPLECARPQYPRVPKKDTTLQKVVYIDDIEVGREFFITDNDLHYRVRFIKLDNARTCEVSSWDDRSVFKQYFPPDFPLYLE